MFLKQPFGQIGGSYCGVPDFTGAPHDGHTGPQVCLTALELGVLNIYIGVKDPQVSDSFFELTTLSSLFLHCP